MVFRVSLVFLMVFLCVLAPRSGFAQADQSSGVLALNVFDLNLDVDSTMDIAGETRFFTSRPNLYAGGRLSVHMADKSEGFFDKGAYFAWCWGKSRYFLNWEEPGLQSFEALDSSIGTFSMPIGMDFNFHLGKILTVTPSVATRMMVLRMVVEIGDEKFSGSALKLGFDAGIKVVLELGQYDLVGGASLTHILNDEINFEVDDLTFDSKTGGSSPEYFLGVGL